MDLPGLRFSYKKGYSPYTDSGEESHPKPVQSLELSPLILEA